jgi:hypothetical protein
MSAEIVTLRRAKTERNVTSVRRRPGCPRLGAHTWADWYVALAIER